MRVPNSTATSCAALGWEFSVVAARAKAPNPGALANICQKTLLATSLAVARHRPHLFRQEMIRRPGSAHHHLAVLQLLGGRAIAVLVFFDGLAVNQVGDIEQHAVGIHALATHFFFERVKQLVYLHRQCTSLGLALAIPRSLLA